MSDETTRRGPDSGRSGEALKVTDRRKFSATGELRPGIAVEDERAPAAKAGTAATPPPAPAAAASPRPAAAGPAGETKPPGAAPADPAGRAARPGAVDFQGLAYFLYMSALQELGVPTEPGAPPGRPDLERARFFIEVLHLLEEKTKGNLAPGEGKLLDEILYNLRMQYVAVSRGAAL